MSNHALLLVVEPGGTYWIQQVESGLARTFVPRAPPAGVNEEVLAYRLLVELKVADAANVLKWFRASRVIELAYGILSRGAKVKNPAGLFHEALRRGWRIDVPPKGALR